MKIDIKQLKFIDLKLRKIVAWLEVITGLEFTITSLYRMNETGVHGTLPLRGIDLRMRSKEIGKIITRVVNRKWMYDTDRPGKKCCVMHGEGSNLHLHIQVHPNTRRL